METYNEMMRTYIRQMAEELFELKYDKISGHIFECNEHLIDDYFFEFADDLLNDLRDEINPDQSDTKAEAERDFIEERQNECFKFV